MPIDNFERDLCREYDGLVGLTMWNIYALSKDDGVIRLLNFNRKNKEHLYMLRVALLARDVYQLPLEIDCGWWDWFVINCKTFRHFKRIKRAHSRSTKGIRTYQVLDFMRPDGVKRLGEYFSFADIYYAYYEGSLD